MWCHGSVAPSFSLANSLISADVLSEARRTLQKQKLKSFFCENQLQKSKNDNKKIRAGDLNLGTVGNRKHTYFFVWPKVIRCRIQYVPGIRSLLNFLIEIKFLFGLNIITLNTPVI